MDLARADVERYARERSHAGKRFLDLAHLEQRSSPRGLGLQRRAHAASVVRVSGSTTIVSTPASRGIASASGGAARSVMSASMRLSGQTTRLRRWTNFE